MDIVGMAHPPYRLLKTIKGVVMFALRVVCWIACGISVILWLLFGMNITRIKSIRNTAIISTTIWVVTSIIVYGS